ncbi:phosphonate metabolism transcriptional regulator PhnF [Bradyrhizobium sp. LHD-71]|uniref:phosphonate metabolism transcriptional regulator PhnF n=1 Tax=Bradyrhizobium sp. LHD-71 TaxID=3072141 RepID=UPI00280EA869|nr:phosphonate metabolism transcriptional regulator PhnF [Bradyrhizobium sp. LHD-71]MDQ8731100.1 phosphonate metabolism transcriptional regulator PhnF [Bradyrhizobium sp. LHD-71]
MGRDAWRAIRDRISDEIASGVLLPGTRLPTEPELRRIFDTGRHSVRRAMAALAMEGKLRVEQGRGTFVEDAPKLNYHVGRRTRFRQNLRSQGFEPSGETISEEIVPASCRVADALQLAEGAPVHRLLRRDMADGVPINLGFTFQCATRFPDWAALRREGQSVTEAYRAHGIIEYFRRSTSVHSRRAREEEAELLQQHIDQPVLVVRKVDVDRHGVPIGHSEGIWAASRVQFVFDGADDVPLRPHSPQQVALTTDGSS